MIYVTGVLPNGAVTIGSNKTIVGLCGAEIHGHVDIVGSSNVIVRNIKIVGYGVGNCALDPSYDSAVGCSSGNDAVTVERGNHIWFDHDDISDGTDGNLDITLGADYVTVSWTKFHYTARTDNTGNDSTGAAGHRYSNLIGGSDNSSADMGKLNITWHHNWWADRVVERQPRIRYGQNHLFNNLWTSSGDNYCVRAGTNAHILLENNAFVGVKTPTEFNNTADQGTSYITFTNNLVSGGSGSPATGGGGTPFTTPIVPVHARRQLGCSDRGSSGRRTAVAKSRTRSSRGGRVAPRTWPVSGCDLGARQEHGARGSTSSSRTVVVPWANFTPSSGERLAPAPSIPTPTPPNAQRRP